MFSPVFYNAVPLNLNHIIGELMFLQLFYFAMELLERYTPNPKAVVEDREDNKGGGSSSSSSFGSSDRVGRSGGDSLG